MKLLLSIVVLLLHAVRHVSCQSAALLGMPKCGLLCLLVAIETSDCAATNQTCICLDPILQANATACITTSCTLTDALVVKNTTETTCGAPVRSRSEMYSTISTTFGVASGVIVLLRIASKVFTEAQWGWDDTTVCIALVSGIPSSVMIPRGVIANGLGKDLWTLAPKQITDFLHFFYAVEVLYFAQVALLKLSLLFFYLRIFPGPSIKRVIQGTIIFDILFGVAFVFAGLFQCSPVSFYWTSWDAEHVGTCINSNVLAWSNAGISIVLDGWMLSLPMSQLLGLQMHWKKKVGVCMMFLVGTFVTVISIIRLQSLVHFSKSTNPTWDDLAAGVWSSIEINVGLICVCMPSLRLLLIRIFPTVFGSAASRTNNKYYLNSSHGHQKGNISISKPKLSSNQSSQAEGITKSQTYTVRYANKLDEGDDDEGLIEMDRFDGKATKSATVV